MACGVIAAIGCVLLCCGGGVGALTYFGFQIEPVAQEPFGQQFTPPNFQPPIVPPPQIASPPVFVPPNFPSAIPGTPPMGRTLSELLAAINRQGAFDHERTAAISEIYAIPIDDAKREEVVETMIKCVEEPSFFISPPAMQVLSSWATKAHTLKLAQCAVNKAQFTERGGLLALIEKLGGDQEVARTIAPLMKDFSAQTQTARILETIGPDAEEPVLAMFDPNDLILNQHLMPLLGKIGGEASKTKLQAATKSEFNPSKFAIEAALREIDARLAKK